MGINIGSRAEIRVAEPFLDLLQRHAVSQQQAGAAMAKIMKPHLRHPVFCYVPIKIESVMVYPALVLLIIVPPFAVLVFRLVFAFEFLQAVPLPIRAYTPA